MKEKDYDTEIHYSALHTSWKKSPCCNLVLYTSNNWILEKDKLK
jgi:hypothetical protein